LPTLSDRDSRTDWESKGSKITWQRAGEIARQLIADSNYRLPEAVRQQILTEIKGIVD
jgi:trimethylamine:corrinoid methyltransferase-like protein